MSCAESWNTDSGVRNPSTASIFIAPDVGTGAGVITDVVEDPAPPPPAAPRSTGLQAIAKARDVHRIVALIRAPFRPARKYPSRCRGVNLRLPDSASARGGSTKR